MLTPGFIENHADQMLPGPTHPAMAAKPTWENLAIHGTKMAKMYLMQGGTTARDAGGANGGLCRAMDSGVIIGSRPDSSETIRLIIKDGLVYKNTLN